MMAGAQEAGHESVPEGALPVDSTLRRATVIFRLLGWAWMFMLGIVTLISDKEANPYPTRRRTPPLWWARWCSSPHGLSGPC